MVETIGVISQLPLFLWLLFLILIVSSKRGCTLFASYCPFPLLYTNPPSFLVTLISISSNRSSNFLNTSSHYSKHISFLLLRRRPPPPPPPYFSPPFPPPLPTPPPPPPPPPPSPKRWEGRGEREGRPTRGYTGRCLPYTFPPSLPSLPLFLPPPRGRGRGREGGRGCGRRRRPR